jgi:hypothetical protein
VRYEGSTPIYYHANSLGSVVALTDESGELVETVEYDVYGETVRKSTCGTGFIPRCRQRG